MRARYPDFDGFIERDGIKAGYQVTGEGEPALVFVPAGRDHQLAVLDHVELTASRRPFIYLPLRHLLEQNFHVRHWLAQYGSGRRLNYDDADPQVLATAIATDIGARVRYRPVETDGAARAAAMLAELM